MNSKFVQDLLPKCRSLVERPSLQLWQALSISAFLLIGGLWLGYVDITWWQVVMVFAVVIGLDYFLRGYLDGKTGFPLSALNSGIGICLFLRTEWWMILFFAAIVAIASKYVLRIRDKHFFNPSYTAIFLMIVLFGNEAYVNHFQWGSDWYVLLPILVMGLFVTYKAGLLDSVLVFWGTILLCLGLVVDFTSEDFVWLFLTGSFLIMSLHGFTDPATMPSVRKYRLLFAAQIAILFFVCRQVINEGYSFFAAYFLVNLFEVGLSQLEGKTWRGYDLRFLVQVVLTVFLALLLLGMSYSFYLATDGIWPELLTNRCVKFICQWGITEAWEVDDVF